MALLTSKQNGKYDSSNKTVRILDSNKLHVCNNQTEMIMAVFSEKSVLEKYVFLGLHYGVATEALFFLRSP